MTDFRKDGQEALALELLRHAAHESAFSYAEVSSLLQKLLPLATDDAHSLYFLMCLLQQRGDAEAAALAQRIHAGIVHKAALTAQTRRTTPEYAWRTAPELAHLPPDIPVGWRDDAQTMASLRQAAEVERDRAFLLVAAPDMTTPLRAITETCVQRQEHLRLQTARWFLLPPTSLWSGFTPPPGCALPSGATDDPQAEESARLADLVRLAVTAADAAVVPEAMQRLVAWPDVLAAPFILQACTVAPILRPYAMHALALRTGIQSVHWADWEEWLQRAGAARIELHAVAASLADEYCDELRLLWLREQPGTPDPALEARLDAAVAESARRQIQPDDFVSRWESILTPTDVIRLGRPLATPIAFPRAVAQFVPTSAVREASGLAISPLSAERTPASTVVSRRYPDPVARPPAEPTVWESHIQPFLAANWYIIAGLLMVVAGASLLAYFTWDKSAFVRYLFLPVLLAAFTGGMAELGLRLFRRHEDLRVTGTFLLGGAVCLLPVNFMVLCRAGDDPRAAAFVLPALGLYAALTGFGLWRWCGVMRRELRLLLGAPLLAVNLLAVLGDMPGIRGAVAGHSAALVPVTITAAVLLLLVVSNRFLQTVLTRELLAAKLVPWFFGITMAATTAQVAAWRHFHLHITPQLQDYALAAILAGATLLRWERRACELRDTGATYGGESFLGYAALLLGILMAAGNEWLRLVALLLAGVVWLVQAPRRPGVVHYWIGTTLCLLGGASIGLLHTFPCSRELNLLPALGLSLAFAVGAVRAFSGRLGETRLRQVAIEIQPPLLLLTAIVAVLSQFHLRSAPWQTGLTLLAVAAFFAVRATRADRRDWLAIAAAAAGLGLPYLGCADMRQYRFDGNTLAMGFGLLATVWLTLARLVPAAVWRTNGSALATCFGGVGMFGLCLRLILANGPALTGADLAGGALLAVTLGVTAWQARAQLPALLAVILLAVILPFFRMPDGAMPTWLYDGSGLTSAVAALALTFVCFAVRRVEIRRGIQNLFSAPILVAVVWLSAKALILQIQPHPDQMPFLVSSICLAMTGYAAAIYARQSRATKLLFHASWVLLGVGIAMGCDAAGCKGMAMFQHPLLWTGVALTVLLAAEAAVARRFEWVGDFFVQPRLDLLSRASVAVAALLTVIIQSPFHDNRKSLHWLALFLAAQLVWHGLRSSRRRFGAVLFALTASWLCACRDLPASFGELPALLLAVLLADVALEFLPKLRAGLHPLRAPFVAGATLLAPFLAIGALFSIHPVDGGMLKFTLQPAMIGLLVVSLLLAARAQACAGFALLAVAFGYLLCLLPCSADELCRPWRLSAFALLLCLIPFLARLLAARGPRLLRGMTSQLPEWVTTSPQAPWFLGPGLLLAVSAACFQVVLTATGQANDARGVQALAPFAAVLAFVFAGWYWRRAALWCTAECLLPLANIFALAVLWGRDLLDLQLMPAHLVGLAAVLTIAEFATLRWLVLRSGSQARLTAALRLHYGCTVLAGLTLVLLGMNYIGNPDLARIPVLRFAVSGVLAFSAGAYFRFAARRPEYLRAQTGAWMESLWHVALGLTLWCGALLIPALRTPQAALYALSLPAAACWIAAEWFLNIRQTTAESMLTGGRFRTSAAAFAMLILVLYVFRLPCQMILFPAAPLNLHVYHTGAAAALLMGLILIRLRGLGGAPWTALSGGLALMTGFYFLATWFPGLSPFAFPMAAAWAAVGAAHLLVLLSYQQSPLRNLIQYTGGIGAEEWHAHRRLWGLFLTVAAHVAVVAGLSQEFTAHSRETTPLLVALASVLIHQAAIGAPWAKAYWGVAVFEILLALHFDFLLPESAPGVIPARQVVWFLLLPWLAAALWWRNVRNWMAPVVQWLGAGRLALICAGHLLYHGPATGSGLLIAAVMAGNGLLTPLAEDAPFARTLVMLILAAPLWLTYFGTRWFTGDNPAGFRPLLGSVTALLGVGMFTRLVESATGLTATHMTLRRLTHEVVAFCRRDGAVVARAFLACAFAGLVLLTFLLDDARHGALARMLGLAFVWGLCCAAWLREGCLRDGALPYTLSVLSLAGVWVMLRRLIFLHFTFWTYEYDVWLSLGASIAFSSAKRLVWHKQPGLARTMTGAVWLLPLLQCLWLLTNHLSADLALIVIGVQAMLFAWHGGGKRDSPYNAVSMLGFVGFVCLLFWARLDLRCLQAYIVPVGLGVLGLVWLFGEHMSSALRNSVRLVTVLAMLGSCGYYALLDNRYPVGFHLTMILLCLGVMALGPLLRVQLYLYFGFAGFATDLVALVVKQFRAFDRSVQMMGIGALLLLLGIAVVGGAILFKTRRNAILTLAARLRARLGAWE